MKTLSNLALIAALALPVGLAQTTGSSAPQTAPPTGQTGQPGTRNNGTGQNGTAGSANRQSGQNGTMNGNTNTNRTKKKSRKQRKNKTTSPNTMTPPPTR